MTGLPVKRSIKIISVKDVSRKKLASQKGSIESQNLKKISKLLQRNYEI